MHNSISGGSMRMRPERLSGRSGASSGEHVMVKVTHTDGSAELLSPEMCPDGYIEGPIDESGQPTYFSPDHDSIFSVEVSGEPVSFHVSNPPEGFIPVWQGGDQPSKFLPEKMEDVAIGDRYGENSQILYRGIDADGKEFYYETSYSSEMRERGFANIYVYDHGKPSLIHESQIGEHPEFIPVKPERSLNFKFIHKDDVDAMQQHDWVKVIDADGEMFCVPGRRCENVGVSQYYEGDYVRGLDDQGNEVILNKTALPEGYFEVDGHYFHQDSPPEGFIPLYARPGEISEFVGPDYERKSPILEMMGRDGKVFYINNRNYSVPREFVCVHRSEDYSDVYYIHRDDGAEVEGLTPLYSYSSDGDSRYVYSYVADNDSTPYTEEGLYRSQYRLMIDQDGDRHYSLYPWHSYCQPPGYYKNALDETGRPVMIDTRNGAVPDGYISVETSTDPVYFHKDSPELPSGISQIPGDDGEIVLVHESKLPENHHVVIGLDGEEISFIDTDGSELPEGVFSVVGADGERIYFHQSSPPDGYIALYNGGDHPEGFLPESLDDVPMSDRYGPNGHIICRGIGEDGREFYYETNNWTELREKGYINIYSSDYREARLIHESQVGDQPDLIEVRPVRSLNYQYIRRSDAETMRRYDWIKVIDSDGGEFCVPSSRCGNVGISQYYEGNYVRGTDENGMAVIIDKTALPEGYLSIETGSGDIYFHPDRLPSGVYQIAGEDGSLMYIHESSLPEGHHIVVGGDGQNIEFVDSDGEALPDGVLFVENAAGDRLYFHKSNITPEVGSVLDSKGNTVYYATDNPSGAGVKSVTVNGQVFMYHESVSLDDKHFVFNESGNLSIVDDVPAGYEKCVGQDGQIFYTNNAEIQSQHIKVYEDGQFVYKAKSQVSEGLIPVQEADGDTYLSDQASLSETYILGTDASGAPVYVNKSELPSGYHVVQDRDGNEICFHEDNLPEDVYVIYYDGEVVYFHKDEIDTRIEDAESTVRRKAGKAKTAIQKIRDRVAELGGDISDTMHSLVVRPIEGLVAPIADILDDAIEAAPMLEAAGEVALVGADVVMGDILGSMEYVTPLVGTLLSLGTYTYYVESRMHRLKKEVKHQRARVQLGQTLDVGAENPVERLFASEIFKKEVQVIRDELLSDAQEQASRFAVLMTQFASGDDVPVDIDELKSEFDEFTTSIETFRSSAVAAQLKKIKAAANAVLASNASAEDVTVLRALVTQLPGLVESAKAESLTWMDLVSDRKGTAGMAVTADAFVDKAKEDQEDGFFTSAGDYMAVLDQLRFIPSGGIIKKHLIEKEGVLTPKEVIQLLKKAGVIHKEGLDKMGRRRYRLRRDLSTYTLEDFKALIDANKEKYAGLIKKLGQSGLAQALYDGVKRMRVRVVKRGVVMTDFAKHKGALVKQLNANWDRLPRDIQAAYRDNAEGLCDAIIGCIENNTAPSFAMVDKLFGSVVSGTIAKMLLAKPTQAIRERSISAKINKELREAGIIKPGTMEEMVKWVSDHCPDAVKKHPKAAKIAASIIMAAGVTVATGGTAAVAMILAELGVGLAGLAASAGGAAGVVTGARLAVQEHTKRGLESELGEMDTAIQAALEAIDGITVNVEGDDIRLVEAK